ncbi:methyl-accepting chemotaxis protein [Kineothrix sp. MSJ-39]|uniref:methyl-accepting chemotaxis protein n=1 Tax=Kineothrix sp. MSJ-39 TaxID=2841533 RepID=UPI001C11A4EB|nr:methyl-accepting chemotaxis protein [Kineothrix sp. MSJ-39]MBU5429509.1 methyl-accepting chemotaxis protein [Kineothrix sp. MSJ-39]
MNQKVKAQNSIKVRLVLSFLIITLATGILLIWSYAPTAERELTELSQHYIEDLAMAYGGVLDGEVKKADGDATYVLKTDALSQKLDGVGIEGVESSYVYVVDENGTMVYHPDGSKIGKPVENEVVKQAVQDVKDGKDVKSGVRTYDYRGEVKYAALYVSTYQKFMLIVSANEKEVLAPVTKMNRMGAISLAGTVIIGLIIGIIFSGVIVKPIVRMTNFTNRLSSMNFSDHETGQKLFARKDEIGAMSRALEHLRIEVAGVVREVREQSELLLEASNHVHDSASETATTMQQLDSAVGEIADGASSQAGDTQLATEKVVNMGDMVEQTADQVDDLMKYAMRMQQSGQGATQALEQLEQVNDQAMQYIHVIAEQTDTTNASAGKIHEAASMITEIAEETNLLSLNASIEAARAGEQGRGFAVVAAQIQKLAEQSNESAKEISEIIRVLMEDSQKAVSIMEDVKEIFKKQSEHVDNTKQAFDEIQKNVEQSIAGMSAIDDKTKRLDKERSGVIDIVQNLSAIAQENAASTEETSASVTEVKAISDQLSEEAVSLKNISYTMEQSMSVFQI